MVGYTANLSSLDTQNRQRSDDAAQQAKLRAMEPKQRPRLLPDYTSPVDAEDDSGRAA